jgi:hypothetical protein
MQQASKQAVKEQGGNGHKENVICSLFKDYP